MADITIDQLAGAISDAVKGYTDDVATGIERRVDQVAGFVRNDIEAGAPKKTGKYAKGFRVSKSDFPGKTRRIVWNKKYANRVHLLEFGHAKRGGGRVQGKPHVRPAYDRHTAQLPDDIRRIIQNGGSL